MKKTTLSLHTKFQIGDVDERIYGGFLEHLGRAVYEGVYDPDSAHADEDGLRTDVMAALDRLQMTAMRYPGGNFVSGYHWEDGVGPKEERPTMRDLAWQSSEPNLFGTDEFMGLSRKMDWTPMFAVNLGTGTPEEARNWVEYCNAPAGTKYSNMRAANGSAEPYGIKLWCLGNEMDGPWQLGHVPADQYAIRAQQAAKMMKDVDPSIELVACGSCTIGLPTYMQWDREVLEYLGDWTDYVSLHRYVGNEDGDTADYLAVTNSIDQQIEEMDAVCKFVQAKQRSDKRVYLCFDEWNVWYRARSGSHVDGAGKFAPPLLEEVYNLEDALVVAGFFNSFIRHADVLKIANIAQIVNVIAPILTKGDDLLIQSIFYPFEMYTKRRDGVALQVQVDGPGYTSESYGEVTTIDASAILGDGQLHVFAVNRDLEESMTIQVDLADVAIAAFVNGELLTGPSADAFNDYDAPDRVKAVEFENVTVADGKATFELPPLAVAALTLGLAE